MKLADLKIDPDFESFLPPLDSTTYTKLEKDILRDGLLSPIVVWDGFILDGHHRYKILKAHRIENVDVKEPKAKISSKSDAIKWIYDHQDHRRNLDKLQLAEIGKKYEAQIRIEAKENQSKYYGNQYQKGLSSNLNEVQSPEPIRTAQKAAKMVGMSENTYRDASLINSQGTEKQKQRVRDGGIGNSISAVAREIKDGVGEGERKCIKCGRILKIEQFRNKKNPYACLECESKRRKMEKEKKEGLDEIEKVAKFLKRTDEVGDDGNQSAIAEVSFLSSNVKSTIRRLMETGKVFDEATMKVIGDLVEYLKNIKGENNYEEKLLQSE